MKSKTEYSYDSSWDNGNEDLYDEKYLQWEKRNWFKWLQEHLTFPFKVKRVEDNDDNWFHDRSSNLFGMGHIMEVLALENEDDLYGIIAKVKEKSHIGHVPLCDLGVASEATRNYWSVREYVVWFANR